MRGKLFLIILLLVLPLQNSYAQLIAASNSACSIITTLGIGSGYCYLEDADNYYYGTAGHCFITPDGTKASKAVCIGLFHEGKQEYIPGEMVFFICEHEVPANDLALIKVEKKDLKGYRPPRVVKESFLDYEKLKIDQIVYSCGFANGGWLTSYKGCLVEPTKDFGENLIYFKPGPKEGRSGSGVYDSKSRFIGMITRRVEKGNINYGMIVTASHIQKLIKENWNESKSISFN